jgi:pSer/pThr/pTyr-binding forkhead associated (FHA) protein
MRVGRSVDNDLVIIEPWVSQHHAEIVYRSRSMTNASGIYYLRDLSRFGSYVLDRQEKWQKIHAQEVPLESGMRLKFGSEDGQTLEFIIEL